MFLDKLKINGFGKLSNKDIKLNKGINIIYGRNEAGKSSILRFITGSLFGISKNKEGKEIADYDKYMPWDGTDYSGKVYYTLDDDTSYEVVRDFKKRRAIVYNKDGEDITKDYSEDKSKGSNFFNEQTGIDEFTFLNTAITEQDAVKLNLNSQSNIIQKISNLISTGDDSVSFKKTMSDLKLKQNERVGTDRTSQKPINIVDDRISKLNGRKQELEEFKSNINEQISNKEELEQELAEETARQEFLNVVKQTMENRIVQEAELSASKKLYEDTKKRLEDTKAKVDDNAEENIKSQKFKPGVWPILLAISIVICVVLFVVLSNKLLAAISLILPCIFIIVLYVKHAKYRKDIKKKLAELDDLQDSIETQIEILEESLGDQIKAYDEKFDKFKREQMQDKDAIKNDYKSELDIAYVLDMLDLSKEDLNMEILQSNNYSKGIEFKLNNIVHSSNQLNIAQEELAQIEAELSDLQEQKNELMSLNNSFEIAKECLEEAYNDVKKNVSPTFINDLSNIISQITNGKYKNIKLNDEEGLMVEVENGQYLPVDKHLSIGTIDQMYLALRLSSIKEVSNETMPIILDEAFAYFDNDRLENILKFIKDNYSNQVLLFTCSNRERQALDNLNIEYNLIEL